MSKAEFDTWHAAEKAARGYPVRGRNAKTGALAPAGTGMTAEIVAPVQVDTTDVRIPLDGTSIAEVKDDKGVVVKPLPGRASWEPARKADGTIDAAASKVQPAVEEPIKGDVVAFEA